MAHGKKYTQSATLVQAMKEYTVPEAADLVKKMATAKFDESVDMSIRLGVDPRHAEQQVRGAVVLPHGTGKTVRILVFARGDRDRDARAAGADYVGAEDYVTKVQEGWTDVDVIIATPDMMALVGRLGRVLGPRGLMPNPKLGTVTEDVTRAVREAKAGKIEYRVDKAGNVHAPVGKVSFSKENLAENMTVLIQELLRAKPSSSKGRYILSAFVSSTMGPSVRVDTNSVTLAT
jgi:large subunit ribosomal protein L1